MMFYICTKFHEISKRVSELFRNLICYKQILKGHKPVKSVGRVNCTVIASVHGLIMLYICTKFHENI